MGNSDNPRRSIPCTGQRHTGCRDREHSPDSRPVNQWAQRGILVISCTHPIHVRCQILTTPFQFQFTLLSTNTTFCFRKLSIYRRNCNFLMLPAAEHVSSSSSIYSQPIRPSALETTIYRRNCHFLMLPAAEHVPLTILLCTVSGTHTIRG